MNLQSIDTNLGAVALIGAGAEVLILAAPVASGEGRTSELHTRAVRYL